MIKLLKNNAVEIECSTTSKKSVLKMVSEIKKSNLRGCKIILTMNEPMSDFHQRIGEVYSNNSDFLDKMSALLKDDNDSKIYTMMGKMILSELIPRTYFIKCDYNKTIYEIRGEKNGN